MGELSSKWNDTKSQEELSIVFLTNILKSSGYEVFKYGIETFAMDIVKSLHNQYTCEVNNHLRSMPDLVIVNPKTGESFLVEVKYRGHYESFSEKSEVYFGYRSVDNYIKYWNDCIMVFIINVEPYMLCVDVSKIDRKTNFCFYKEKDGHNFEVWRFDGLYKKLPEKFIGVDQKIIYDKLHLIGIQKNGR